MMVAQAQTLYSDVDTWNETCSEALLEDPNGDGIVNQHELADFFTEQCRESTECELEEGESYSFTALPLKIQILFHLGTCWNSPDKDFNYTEVTTDMNFCEECYEAYIESRNNNNNQHGVTPNPDHQLRQNTGQLFQNFTSELCVDNNTTSEVASVGIILQKNVTVVLQHFCVKIWDSVVKEGIITLGGVLAPSGLPSSTPTSLPTSAPSAAPSAEPSFAPTVSQKPSFAPTVSHQPSLSFNPTYITPSGFPTGYPTMVESHKPSKPKKQKPSSPAPSLSMFPSSHPTAKPSTTPSEVPTFRPSSSPSRLPSASPSDVPSFVPSVEPSAEPSSTPTAAPT